MTKRFSGRFGKPVVFPVEKPVKIKNEKPVRRFSGQDFLAGDSNATGASKIHDAVFLLVLLTVFVTSAFAVYSIAGWAGIIGTVVGTVLYRLGRAFYIRRQERWKK